MSVVNQATESEPRDEKSIYRVEALQFSNRRSLGSVTIIQPLALITLTGLLVFIVVTTGVYLTLGEYARKETVAGYLEPSGGLAGVFARSNGGIIHTIEVQEGELVGIGEPIITLRFPNTVTGGNSTIAELIKELREQQLQLTNQLGRYDESLINERRMLNSMLTDQKLELKQQERALGLQRQRVKVSSKMLESMRRLHASGAISESQQLQMVSENLEYEKNEISISQRIIQLQSAGKSVEHQLRQLPTDYADRRLQTELQLSQISQKITETLGRKDELILAPITGRISGLQAKVGTPAAVGKSLLSIIPDNSSLEVILLLPSSAIGFVDPGQSLRLMYDSFPHQQFGTHAAKLVSISEAPISASELQSPFEVGGPVYIARAQLASDTIRVLGEQRRLTSGMSLRADIILERRSLIDWLLAPLYSIRGRTE